MTQEHRKQQSEGSGEVIRRFATFEHRAAKGEAGQMVIEGMGAVFNQYTLIGDYLERIMPGFFDGAATERCACLKNHDPNLVLGRTSNGSLTLQVTPDGLQYRSVLPDTTTARDTYTEVQGGYLTQSSFAFTVKSGPFRQVAPDELRGQVPEEWINRAMWNGKVTVRDLVQAGEVLDVSPVTYPAYATTTAATASEQRSLQQWRDERGGEQRKDEQEQTPVAPTHEQEQLNRRLRIAEAASRKFNQQTL